MFGDDVWRVAQWLLAVLAVLALVGVVALLRWALG